MFYIVVHQSVELVLLQAFSVKHFFLKMKVSFEVSARKRQVCFISIFRWGFQWKFKHKKYRKENGQRSIALTLSDGKVRQNMMAADTSTVTLFFLDLVLFTIWENELFGVYLLTTREENKAVIPAYETLNVFSYRSFKIVVVNYASALIRSTKQPLFQWQTRLLLSLFVKVDMRFPYIPLQSYDDTEARQTKRKNGWVRAEAWVHFCPEVQPPTSSNSRAIKCQRQRRV